MSNEARWTIATWGLIALSWLHSDDVISLMLAVGAFACWLMSFNTRASR